MGISGGPYIIRDSSLVLELDAADRNSYIGSGTVWTDLSGNGNTSTLTNGPTFNSSNGGNIVFDGADDYVSCGTSSSLQGDVGTCCCWVKTTSPGSSFRGIIVKQQGWGLFVVDGVFSTYDWGNVATRSTGANIATGLWNHVAMSFTDISGTPSNNASLYLNGSLVLLTTVKKTTPVTTLVLGSGSPAGSQFINGSISQAQLYNRALSAAEVLQNYTQLKSRFNL
jgi:hypothetical protein